MDIPSILDARVDRVMREVVSALAPETSLAAAARLFVERHISGAPVVDREGRPIGVVSQTDLIAGSDRAPGGPGHADYYVMMHGRPVITSAMPDVAAGFASRGVVADVMTRHLITVEPGAPLRDAIALMASEEVHRVLVVGEGRLLGVVTSMDVLRTLAPRAAPRATSGF